MSIEKEVIGLLGAFNNVYFNNYHASLLISERPITIKYYNKITIDNKQDLEDTLSGSVDLRLGHGDDGGNVLIEVWLGDGVVGHYFEETQRFLATPWGMTDLLVEIFNDIKCA